jgi:phosphate transport system substrate-binding protein
VNPHLHLRPAAVVLGCALAACISTSEPRPEGTVRYEGSSTVAIFLRAAEPEYGVIEFEIDTSTESGGGECAILASKVDLAGIARTPRSETLLAGVKAELIGRDAIAVIVNAANPITALTSEELQRIFTGQAKSWLELGGPDLPVRPFIAGSESATREVFRKAVLGGQDYTGCEEVRPDEVIISRVAETPGGVGHISFSFLVGGGGVRAVRIDEEDPDVTNFDYPISRPLYLLWRSGSPVVDSFVAWTTGPEGQTIVMQSFVGTSVVGSVRSASAPQPTGTLIVHTETFPFDDGGIFYYPHRPYEILDRQGNLLRRIRNHRGRNDEQPSRVDLPQGTYLIRVRSSRGKVSEYFVTIEAGKTTELDVKQVSQGK